MQWTSRQPFVPPALLDRLDRGRLRRAALRYAAQGWQVTPGAYLAGHRFHCGRPGCPITACHPALDAWAAAATVDPGRIARWWRRQAHTVLLPTGSRFDVLEVPAALGRQLPALGPVAVTAAGRWMLLVGPGRPLRPELENRIDVVRHGIGSWIPAPPNRLLDGPIRWTVAPEQVDWRMPDAERVQELLVVAAGPAPGRPLIPRQLSTSRRAA
ncbi:bifunctional DNA primase/polymerase [Actinoplanes sp. DH11]|uniref:bifunctional DNA primase/polymerase n=1 Tax=Actinoplanes sp. DH11 TaxID=2857011 RepID=UPI001E3D9B9A|nr:bifunctional DNA primase/polymerase [Actinoplanes sp. DH11]